MLIYAYKHAMSNYYSLHTICGSGESLNKI